MPEHNSLNFQVIALSYHAACQHTDDTQICLLSMLNSQIFFLTVTEPQWTEATRVSNSESPTIWILHPLKFCLCTWGHLRWPQGHVLPH